jgi:hypothetical protein
MKNKLFPAVLTIALAALASPAMAQDADRKVEGGGIAVEGWKGKIDAGAAKKGMTLADSKFAASGDDLHLTIGPAAFYWKDANTAKGSYTISATFKEPKPSERHPHPYGLFIGGKDLESDAPNLVYCLAYSNGTYLVRGFAGGKVVNVAARAPHDAVAKPAADGSVAQSIAWTVKDGTATCSINGQAIGTFNAETLALQGISTTDGIYGIRASHNLDVIISGFGKK